jgi:hypothetical protein
MKLKLTPQFILSFLALTFVMHEAHEIVHTSIGRLICGCWGQRDFNVWGLCEGCDTILATLAGPIFTFSMIWIGAYLLKETNSNKQKSIGFALIFSNMGFGRLLNPILGGGDEVVVVNNFIPSYDLSRIIVIVCILLITAYPFYKAFILIKNDKRIGWFLLFLLVPFVIDLLVVLGLMNTLLEKGLLKEYWILGSPILVTVWTVFVVSIFALTKNNIYKLTDE